MSYGSILGTCLMNTVYRSEKRNIVNGSFLKLKTQSTTKDTQIQKLYVQIANSKRLIEK